MKTSEILTLAYSEYDGDCDCSFMCNILYNLQKIDKKITVVEYRNSVGTIEQAIHDSDTLHCWLVENKIPTTVENALNFYFWLIFDLARKGN